MSKERAVLKEENFSSEEIGKKERMGSTATYGSIGREK